MVGAERAAPAPGEGVGVLRLLVFGAPATAYAFYLLFIQFYFLKFATDVLLAAPAMMGALIGFGRIWDAVSDPLAGTWSDRTRSRLGRRRPWMLAAVPLLAMSFVMIWSPPAVLAGGALTLWTALSLLAFYTAYTIYTIPHMSLGAELTKHHHERSRVFGAQRMAFVFGILLAFGGIHYTTNAADERAAAARLAVLAAVVASAVLLLPALFLRERAEYQGRGGASPYRALADVLRNPHARIILTAWFVEGLAGGVLGVLAPYLAVYVIGRPDLIAVIPAFYVVFGVLSIPLWIAASRRFGKRDTWLVALAGNALFFGATFFVGEGQIALLCALLAGAGASNACGGAIGASMLADVIDWDEWKSGERKEGAYSAAWGFALKLAIGVVVVLTGVALQLSGFTPNVEQGPATRLMIRGLFAGAPLAAALLAIALLRRFRLDASEHARIRGDLDARSARPG